MRDRRRILIAFVLTIERTAIRVCISAAIVIRATKVPAPLVLIKALLPQIRNLFMLALCRGGEIAVELVAESLIIAFVLTCYATTSFNSCDVVLVSAAIGSLACLAIARWVVGCYRGLTAVPLEILL